MTSRAGGAVWTQTTNGQYGQWFDVTRRTTSARHGDHSASRPVTDHAHASRDPATPRDLPPPSCDDSKGHGVSCMRPAATLPPSLQRSATTLGVAGRISASGVDGLSGQVHADLIRDYQRYRRLQAGIASERDTGRLLGRAAAGGTSTSTTTVSGGTQRRADNSETTTVVPLQLAVGGPLPLQRSVGNVMVTARRLSDDFNTVRRAHSGYSAGPGRPVTSLFASNDDNVTSPSDNSDVTRQLNAVTQVDWNNHSDDDNNNNN